MNENTIPQLLGVDDNLIASIRSGQLPYMRMMGRNNGTSDFMLQLEEALKDARGSTSPVIPEGISLDRTQTAGLDHSLGGLFKVSMLGGLKPTHVQSASWAGEARETSWLADAENDSTESAGSESSLVEDVLSLADSKDTAAAQPMSAQDIVMTAGYANGELIQKINDSATLAERLGYVEQLRDNIIEALRAAGHTAYDVGKPDKISIDGELYDVIRASRGLGMETNVQFLEVKAATAEDSLRAAIFDAGEKGIDMLPQISASTSLSERRNLAIQFRDQLVANLKEKGYDVTALDSPDKIKVNGVTYDIMRSLNDPSSMVRFQALKV